MSGQQVLVKRLGALPVIRDSPERLGLRERVDARAPVRAVAPLPHGAVGEALVAHRLTAPRPWYDLVAWAEAWAVAAPVGLPPAVLHADRLGRSWTSGRGGMMRCGAR